MSNGYNENVHSFPTTSKATIIKATVVNNESWYADATAKEKQNGQQSVEIHLCIV